MIQSDLPEIVTIVACPPADTTGSTDNAFIDAVLQTLARKPSIHNKIIRAANIRDADIELAKLLPADFKSQVRLQIVGHSISGMLSLGATWLPEADVIPKAFLYPFYVFDTNPAALGLLAKYAGKISEVMLVGCNIGSASSFGYAVNGRTLTYTLAELLRCLVRGADDIVSPDEFDASGWYEPGSHHRRSKGWRWVESTPPVWTDPNLDPVPMNPPTMTQAFEIRAITSSLLPARSVVQPRRLAPPIRVNCRPTTADKPRSALAELSVETDQGTAQLLCGGRYLKWSDAYYMVDKNRQLSSALTSLLW